MYKRKDNKIWILNLSVTFNTPLEKNAPFNIRRGLCCLKVYADLMDVSEGFVATNHNFHQFLINMIVDEKYVLFNYVLSKGIDQ